MLFRQTLKKCYLDKHSSLFCLKVNLDGAWQYSPEADPCFKEKMLIWMTSVANIINFLRL